MSALALALSLWLTHGAASDAALALIREHEGLRLCAYADPVGLPTIGYGHTSAADPRGLQVRAGLCISRDEAERILHADASEALADLRAMTGRELTRGEEAAYTSWIFNVGAARAAYSGLMRELRRGHRKAACRALLQWTRCGNHSCPGLVRRRAAEYAVCISELQP